MFWIGCYSDTYSGNFAHGWTFQRSQRYVPAAVSRAVSSIVHRRSFPRGQQSQRNISGWMTKYWNIFKMCLFCLGDPTN